MLRRTRWKHVLLFNLLLIGLTAQNTYQVDTRYPVHPLEDYLLVFEDTTLAFTIDQVRADPVLPFLSRSAYGAELDYKAAYWAKVRISSQDGLEQWALHFEDRNYGDGGWGRGNGKVEVYAFQEDHLLWYKKSGVDYPSSEREIPEFFNQNRISLDLLKGDTITLYIRVEGNSFGFPPFFNAVLRTKEFQHFHPFHNRFTFVNDFVLGIIFISLVYHFLLYIYLKQQIYLWFSVWLFVTLLTMSINVDFGPLMEFLFGEYPTVHLLLWMLLSSSVWFVFWFFGRAFVGTREKYPILDKFIAGLIVLLLTETLVNVAWINISDQGPYNGNPGIHYMLLSLFTFIGFIFAILLALKKDPLARYFGIGAMVATVAPMIGGLWAEEIIQLPFDPFVWGIFLQIVAYSFGIAYRQQIRDKAFQQAQLSLVEAERDKLEIQRIKDLDEMKSKFFANISHEFRTPLSLITGPLQQAQTGERGVLLRHKSYDILQRNANRLKELVDQLLELSKIETGQSRLELQPGDVIGFATSIARDFQALSESKSIRYQLDRYPNAWSAYFDADKLQKILQNLLSNAFKFTPAGGSVCCEIKQTKGGLHLTISDSGQGIPQEEISKIFDRFYRVERNEAQGSGIGLALTKELVVLHQGSIEVDSTEGSGTTIEVRIPYRSVDDISESPVIDSKLAAAVAPTKESALVVNQEENEVQICILVVEDNSDLRSFIAEILGDLYKVLLAEDGKQGEAIAIEQTPHLIISDVMMPNQNGFELCQNLKSNIKTSHIPIILLTAKAGQENKISGLTQGADVYMTKPFDAEELLLRVGNLLQAREAMWSYFQSKAGFTEVDIPLASMEDQFYQQVIATIHDNLSEEAFSVEDLVREVGFSRSQFHRKLKAISNKSANQLIREIRLGKAKQILESRAMGVSETAYAVGYSSLSYFTKSFKDTFGYLPSSINHREV